MLCIKKRTMEKIDPITIIAVLQAHRLRNLNAEIGALDRLVDEKLARNPVRKPVQGVTAEEMEMAARA